ncbi:MAG: hypothetical protein ACLRWL_01250 [Evtepia gabavorous]
MAEASDALDISQWISNLPNGKDTTGLFHRRQRQLPGGQCGGEHGGRRLPASH